MASLSYNELKPGIVFKFEGQSYEVLESGFLRMQQRKPVMQVRMKNLLSGKVVERNFHQNDDLVAVEIERLTVKFLYGNRGQYWFSALDNPKDRFIIEAAIVGEQGKFLKPNSEITILKMEGNIFSVQAPIKIALKVKETPPGEKGDTVTGGTKPATLETGAVVSVPLFINEGDTILVNTQSGEYVERAEKG